jgi:hypothetical protein
MASSWPANQDEGRGSLAGIAGLLLATIMGASEHGVIERFFDRKGVVIHESVGSAGPAIPVRRLDEILDGGRIDLAPRFQLHVMKCTDPSTQAKFRPATCRLWKEYTSQGGPGEKRPVAGQAKQVTFSHLGGVKPELPFFIPRPEKGSPFVQCS